MGAACVPCRSTHTAEVQVCSSSAWRALPSPTLPLPLTPQVISLPEPHWDQPIPADWVHGGGWGTQRMVFFSGMG